MTNNKDQPHGGNNEIAIDMLTGAIKARLVKAK